MTDKLLEGFEAFFKEAYIGRDAAMPRLVEEGQKPEYFVISCIDSRSNPGTIFRAAPGTFFAFKAMGAIARPYKQGTNLAASLQFAIEYSGVKKIIVLGHTQCGAIKALVEKLDDPEIASFVQVARKGLDLAQKRFDGSADQDADILLRAAEEEIVLESVHNLKTYPAVAKALENGELVIKPWIFDMAQGALSEYNEHTKMFEVITNTGSHKHTHTHGAGCGC